MIEPLKPEAELSDKTFDFWRIKHQIDDEIARLGWSKQKCTALIIKRYGKISRLVMTDEQLIDLLDYLLGFRSKTYDTTQHQTKTRRKKKRRR